MVGGNNKKVGSRMISKVLSKHFRVKEVKGTQVNPWALVKNNVLIFTSNNYFDLKPFFNCSRKPIFAVTVAGQIPPSIEDDLFASKKERVERESEFSEELESSAKLVVNYDDETVREMEENTKASPITFGLGEGSDLRATDVQITKRGTNFKINHKGNIVPVWLEKLFGKRQVYGALLACAIAQELDINLIKASRNLKYYQGTSGEGRLVKGIKNTRILDDSANADPFSMAESLLLLRNMNIDEQTRGGRKIAVLGDVLRIGKYSVEAHETMGEKVAKSADLLFTVGSRAKFIQKGALAHGLEEKNTFHFSDVEKAGKVIQDKIKENDLILIDGSAEMKMDKIVKEIKRR